MTENSIATLIEAAFRKLEIPSENEWNLPLIVHTLALIPCGEDGTTRREFREIGRKGAQKELDDIAKVSEKLKNLIDGLSQTSITALADAGLLQVVHPRTLSTFLGYLETSAKSADISHVPEKQGAGQPPNNLATSVANILASNYFVLTGSDPTVSTKNNGLQDIPYGSYFDLVSDVFSALKISASPEAASRAAVKGIKGKKVAEKKL